MKKLSVIFFLLVLLFSSCSVERRHYRSGFYIDRSKHISSVQQEIPASSSEQKTIESFSAVSEPVVIPQKNIPAIIQRETQVVKESLPQPIQRSISQLTSSNKKFIPGDTLQKSGVQIEDARRDIRESLVFNALNLLLVAPLSVAAYFLMPAFLSGDAYFDEGYIIFLSPLISIAMGIFAIKSLKSTWQAMRTLRHTPGNGGWRMGAALALLLSVVSFCFGLTSIVVMIMEPALLLLAILSLLLLLLGALLSW